ncbi:pentatricopeptide repeat-containing protein [Pyrus ussuriensis x Pyrus communis]|uniref:Pentatricopeptide repeat-containing protein n=1 Tax=Pyrus ussuriensis x Pyrus communis TaxID=2448454 RepID=A0A5N5FVF0_9ROSA|nr:pentatricopeptide repeat-containing protein [Pyrus ussuriensis x Pyrus communis]
MILYRNKKQTNTCLFDLCTSVWIRRRNNGKRQNNTRTSQIRNKKDTTQERCRGPIVMVLVPKRPISANPQERTMPDLASARDMTKSGLVKSQFQANKRTLRPKVYPRNGNVEVADPKANKLSTDTSSDLKGVHSSVLRFC